MRIRFLADANFDQDIVSGLWRRQPLVEFDLPQEFIPDGTADPEVLAIAARLGAVGGYTRRPNDAIPFRRLHQALAFARLDHRATKAGDCRCD